MSGLGAKAIRQYDKAGVKVAPSIKLGIRADLEYDGTDFILVDALPLFDDGEFVSSKTPAGYQMLPGGSILQWGYQDGYFDFGLGSSGHWQVIFPIAFPNACLSVTVSGGEIIGTQESSEHIYSAFDFAQTGFSIYMLRVFGSSGGTSDLFRVRYMAIGY
uniref:Putative tail fiber protein gp53-like C-terminal domain-containing protein n=1 Tax=Candidatus Kentrum sp. TC TaxID=2126339 RepID=A0A450Z5R2_9GAMM|nr:MAG: hypothetical protein BECKTC1821E_GA0114239_11573 [Candidatus Kentron sp. TC]